MNPDGGKECSWDLKLPRHLTDREMVEGSELLSLSEGVQVREGGHAGEDGVVAR